MPGRADHDPKHHLGMSRCRSGVDSDQYWHARRSLCALYGLFVNFRVFFHPGHAHFLLLLVLGMMAKFDLGNYLSTTRGSFGTQKENRTRMHIPGGGLMEGVVGIFNSELFANAYAHTPHAARSTKHTPKIKKPKYTTHTSSSASIEPVSANTILHAHFTVETIKHPPSAAPAVSVWTNQHPPREQITINQDHHEIEKSPATPTGTNAVHMPHVTPARWQ